MASKNPRPVGVGGMKKGREDLGSVVGLNNGLRGGNVLGSVRLVRYYEFLSCNYYGSFLLSFWHSDIDVLTPSFKRYSIEKTIQKNFLTS